MTVERPPLDVQVTLAIIDLIGRSGATDVEMGFLSDDEPYLAWAKANFRGHRIYAENHANMDFALMDVARRVVHVGQCVDCGRTISFPHLTPGHCGRVLVMRDMLTYEKLCDEDSYVSRT